MEGPNLRMFERRLDQYWRQPDLKHNPRGAMSYSPISNQWLETNGSDGLFTWPDPDSEPYLDSDSCITQKFPIGSDSDSDHLIEM